MRFYYRKQDADKLTDPAAKQAGLDQAASFAQRGLSATAPAGSTPADFDNLKKRATPTFESAVAEDDMAKKDNAGAITALTAELTGADPKQLTTVGPVLQDEYTLAQPTTHPLRRITCTAPTMLRVPGSMRPRPRAHPFSSWPPIALPSTTALRMDSRRFRRPRRPR